MRYLLQGEIVSVMSITRTCSIIHSAVKWTRAEFIHRPKAAVLNWRSEKGLLGVRTFLPNCSLIYNTSDHNADVTNLGVFVSLMLYKQLTVM